MTRNTICVKDIFLTVGKPVNSVLLCGGLFLGVQGPGQSFLCALLQSEFAMSSDSFY